MNIYVIHFIVIFTSIISRLSLILSHLNLFLNLMERFKYISSPSSSLSIYRNNNNKDILDSNKSIICLNEKNSHRLIQSLTDIRLNHLNSSEKRFYSKNPNRIIRIESALITSDYCHLPNHSQIYPSQTIININMNRKINLIKQNEINQKNFSSYSKDKEINSSSVIENYHDLVLEQVPIQNRPKIQLTSKQLILISICVFLIVIMLCLIIFFCVK